MKKIVAAGLSLILLIGASSCTKNYIEVISSPEKHFYKGEFSKAAKILQPLIKKKKRNQLLFMMECGYIFHAAGAYEASNDILLRAAEIAKVKPISISKQVASLFLNERRTNYRGEDFEKVLIHMYLGINFLMLKKYEEALVEFKDVNEELEKIKLKKVKIDYKQNIMAKYLTAITYEIIGDIEKDEDDLEYAYIEYKQILQLNPKLEIVYRDLKRISKKLDYLDDYEEWKNRFPENNNIPEDAGEIIVIFQSGRGAIKKSRGRLLADRSFEGAIIVTLGTRNLAAGVTTGAVLKILSNVENPIPKFVRRSNRIDYIHININDVNSRTYMLEDISGTAIRNLNDSYPKMRRKVAASIAVKAAATVAAGIAAQQIAKSTSNSSFGSLIGLIAGLGTGVALFSQIKPDLRCWHTLPANLQLGRIFLKPGIYTVVLKYIDKNGAVYKQESINVNVKKGEKIFINRRILL